MRKEMFIAFVLYELRPGDRLYVTATELGINTLGDWVEVHGIADGSPGGSFEKSNAPKKRGSLTSSVLMLPSSPGSSLCRPTAMLVRVRVRHKQGDVVCGRWRQSPSTCRLQADLGTMSRSVWYSEHGRNRPTRSRGVTMPCAIWNTPATEEPRAGHFTIFDSPRAGGRYKITDSAVSTMRAKSVSAKKVITIWLCDQRRLGVSTPTISSYNIDEIGARPLLGFSKRVERALLFIASKITRIDHSFQAGNNDATNMLGSVPA
jgi:hypothetical protein